MIEAGAHRLADGARIQAGRAVANHDFTALASSGATVFLEEETSADPETEHSAESVGGLAIEAGLITAACSRGAPPEFPERLLELDCGGIAVAGSEAPLFSLPSHHDPGIIGAVQMEVEVFQLGFPESDGWSLGRRLSSSVLSGAGEVVEGERNLEKSSRGACSSAVRAEDS